MPPILQVRDIAVEFPTREGTVNAVNGVNFILDHGETMCLVGESGAGKSMTALAVLQLLPYPGKLVRGDVLFEGQSLPSMKENDLRKIRGREIALVSQDAKASLNPIISVGTQMEEMLLAHTEMTKLEARDYSIELLHKMEIPEAKRVVDYYPFQLSGGMAQRVMLAMALSLRPKLLIADEPTSGLDVTLQAEMLLRLRALKEEIGASILLITHDLGVVAQMADQVKVMYGGSIVESGTVGEVFKAPRHPYTWGLFQALPRWDDGGRLLNPIKGMPPSLLELPDRCSFLDRCPKASSECRLSPRPPLTLTGETQLVACYNPLMDQ